MRLKKMERRVVDRRSKIKYNCKNCKFCNIPFFISKIAVNHLKNGGLYCSRKCYYDDHFKATRFIRDKIGYVYISIRNSDGSTKYVFEHRAIMEAWLGRELKRKEQVHHINRNPSDNRIENLQTLSILEHKQIHNRKYFGTLCKIHNCTKKAISKGFCSGHYGAERSRIYRKKEKELEAIGQ